MNKCVNIILLLRIVRSDDLTKLYLRNMMVQWKYVKDHPKPARHWCHVSDKLPQCITLTPTTVTRKPTINVQRQSRINQDIKAKQLIAIFVWSKSSSTALRYGITTMFARINPRSFSHTETVGTFVLWCSLTNPNGAFRSHSVVLYICKFLFK